MSLLSQYPFPDGHFSYAYAEDFLEHLDQSDSVIFLSESYRTLAHGGVLRLSFPGLKGVLKRHYRFSNFQGASQGKQEAYIPYGHRHFYCEESLSLVARHIGFRQIEFMPFQESNHQQLRGIDTRADEQADLNLIAELTK